MLKAFRVLAALGAAGGATVLGVSDAAALLPNSGGPIDFLASEPPNYDNCTLCHSDAAVNSGSGSVEIDGVPSVYTPGATYSLTVTLSDPVAQRWGFELVALDENDAGAGSVALTEPARTLLSSVSGREYVKQSSTGSDLGKTGSNTWTFDWTAPAAGTGTIRFFASGNAANGNSNTDGDLIYNCASAAAETGTAHPEATLVMQPEAAWIQQGDAWTVFTRVRDHSSTSWTPVFVSNVTLPNAQIYPGVNQFLASPISHALSPEGLHNGSISHTIPGTAPLGAYQYNGFLGLAPNTLIDSESFAFNIY